MTSKAGQEGKMKSNLFLILLLRANSKTSSTVPEGSIKLKIIAGRPALEILSLAPSGKFDAL